MIDKRGPLKSKAQQRSGTHYNKKMVFYRTDLHFAEQLTPLIY